MEFNLCGTESALAISNSATNIQGRVDKDRVKEVGPDRACAEWLLRSGASVRWCGQGQWLAEYNLLPRSQSDRYKIEEIDATGSCIMDMGFEHFGGLQALRRVILHQCLYIGDPALSQLSLVAQTLESLQISACPGISEMGLYKLAQLRNLKSLRIYNLPRVKDMESVVEFLQKSLPKCDLQLTKPSETRL